jgi:hypothetical protein
MLQLRVPLLARPAVVLIRADFRHEIVESIEGISLLGKPAVARHIAGNFAIVEVRDTECRG